MFAVWICLALAVVSSAEDLDTPLTTCQQALANMRLMFCSSFSDSAQHQQGTDYSEGNRIDNAWPRLKNFGSATTTEQRDQRVTDIFYQCCRRPCSMAEIFSSC